MVRKTGKVLCCIFLLAILGVTDAQNLVKTKSTVMCAHTTNQQKRYLYMVYKHKTKDMVGQGQDLSVFVCFFDVYWSS